MKKPIVHIILIHPYCHGFRPTLSSLVYINFLNFGHTFPFLWILLFNFEPTFNQALNQTFNTWTHFFYFWIYNYTIWSSGQTFSSFGSTLLVIYQPLIIKVIFSSYAHFFYLNPPKVLDPPFIQLVNPSFQVLNPPFNNSNSPFQLLNSYFHVWNHATFSTFGPTIQRFN